MKKSLWPVVIIYLLLFTLSLTIFQKQHVAIAVEDHARLLPVKMKTIKSSQHENDLKEIILDANKENEKISIAGMQYSQGGQTLYPNGVLLDMKPYNKILNLDEKNKTITVQSGVTWEDIQSYINPYGLSLRVSQSQNIFTVGGSLSVNVHGRNIAYTSLIETVESFRLLNAHGEILNVSREENAELFSLVIGGYGLFGVILDVTLHLTNDELYQIRTTTLDSDEYSDYFKDEVLGDEQVQMHLARLSVAPDNFLKEMYTTDYLLAQDQSLLSKHSKLKRESYVAIPKFFLGLSRLSAWGKNVMWDTQKAYNQELDGTYISRNNVMRSESDFMNYEHGKRTEVLQEYFVPVEEFAAYVDELRVLLEKEELNLLNITVRYVKKDKEAVMAYAKEDMFGLVLLINQKMTEKDLANTEKVIQQMVDVTLAHKGSYYLPYYHFPTREQLEAAYPRTEEFFEMKDKYDTEHRFLNLFYEEYHK